MTVSSSLNKIIYQGDGTTKTFSIPFYVLASADIQLSLVNIATQVETVITSNYTVNYVGTGWPSETSTITYPVDGNAVTDEYDIVVLRYMDYVQETTYSNNAAFSPKSLEKALDKMEMQVQQLAEESERSVKVGIASDDLATDYMSEIRSSTALSETYATNASDSADIAQEAADSTAGSVASASASALSASTSASSASTSEDNAKTSENNAKTSELNAGISETEAMAQAELAQSHAYTANSYKDTAGTYATNASNSATSADNSANSASASAVLASNSEANAQAQSGYASGYSETAGTYATNSLNSASEASDFATQASGYATTATTQATTATEQATIATNYANSILYDIDGGNAQPNTQIILDGGNANG